MKNNFKMLINGELVTAQKGETMEIINPANGQLVGLAPKGTPADINSAVEAAWKAAPGWAATYSGDRAQHLVKLAAVIRAHHDELTKLETAQYGGPISKTSNFDIPFSSLVLEFFAGVGRSQTGLTLNTGPTCKAMTVREPLGVVGLITPWNFPLVTILSKVAPALITGNTCVVKPPSCAPLTALKLSEMVIEAGLPKGIINIVTGPGSTTGEALVCNPKVAKINFTGDSETGKRIMSLASANIKPVASELGGKNAFIVMADADLDATVEGAIWGAFFNSGQNCGAASRYLIHESIYDEFAKRFVAAARKIKVGDPMKMETMMGPVAYKGSRDNIEGFIERAKKSGAKLLLGGERPNTPETKDGCYVAPTIFGDCDPHSELMQEEVFGPVVGLMRFKTDEEAVDIANDTRFGLCASIWTRDLRRGLVMTGKIKVGTIWLNQHLSIVFDVPWGGSKESGWSKENSILVLDEYTMSKDVWIDLVGTPETAWKDII
jgi:acyl-CoA reductase-like NAD-dependent aldehyde dehydrogenase